MVIVAAVYHVFSMPIVRAVPAHYDRPGVAAEDDPYPFCPLFAYLKTTVYSEAWCLSCAPDYACSKPTTCVTG